MGRRKLFGTLGLLVLLLAGLWYFVLKGYNYRVTFETPHAPGTVYSSLLNLGKWKLSDADSVALINTDPYGLVEYNHYVSDSLINFSWNIERINDSTTKVIALSKDVNNPVIQNLKVIFGKNSFVQRSIKTTREFMNSLYMHRKEYKAEVTVDSLVTVPSQYCAFIELESSIYQKGNTMISNIGLIMNYIKDHDIPLDGDPFLRVTNWDQKNEVIAYEFCFPIKKTDSLPPAKTIKFKNTEEFMAVKAIFNGNYRLSDRAWYELLDHANRKGLEVNYTPLEIYRNDPHSGGNELEWVAEVYMPIKE